METSTIHQADGGGEEEWAESQQGHGVVGSRHIPRSRPRWSIRQCYISNVLLLWLPKSLFLCLFSEVYEQNQVKQMLHHRYKIKDFWTKKKTCIIVQSDDANGPRVWAEWGSVTERQITAQHKHSTTRSFDISLVQIIKWCALEKRLIWKAAPSSSSVPIFCKN